jgi:hypothetical protein
MDLKSQSKLCALRRSSLDCLVCETTEKESIVRLLKEVSPNKTASGLCKGIALCYFVARS